MDYIIKHITTVQELDKAAVFAQQIFPEHQGFTSLEDTRNGWIPHMENTCDLLLYAESGDKIVGIVFGSTPDDGKMSIMIVAVDERFRKHGLAREMVLLLEERAKAHGVHVIGLGAVQSAEGFYAKIGYTGSLLIQSEKHSIDELLSLNTKYKVNYTRVHDGTINQVNLALTEADRELQRKYETELPGCYTQMMFWKNI
jgi:GNAT superfamily N-acetyltransferase